MKKFLPTLLGISYLLIYILLYKIYIPRVNAFGCFDDCLSYAAGYFLNDGKILYSQIFYNHQLLPAYISSFIQNFLAPINLFDLILKHRQFVFFFGFLFNLILILRFRLAAFLFFIFFEFSKFYIFGDRFLGGNLVVYPTVYLTFLVLHKLQNKKLYKLDYILSTIFLWFIFFTRETFSFLSILYGLLIFYPLKKFNKTKIISISLFLLLSLTTMLLAKINFSDYLFNVYTVNKSFFGQIDFLKAFVYPIYLLFVGDWNIFRILITGLDIVLIFLLINLFKQKNYKIFVFILVSLFLANLRPVPIGRNFYDAFHMVPYFGIFVTTTFYLLFGSNDKKVFILSLAIIVLVFISFIFSPSYFAYEKIDPQKEFLINYQNILTSGEEISKLLKKEDTLFVDGFDEVIYWVTKADSSYKYSMYTSLMPNIPKYYQERMNMFKTNPPDIYYGNCPNEKNPQRLIPQEFKRYYKNVELYGEPSCIFKYAAEN